MAALLLIPSTLEFAPLGAAGTPAQILGLAAAGWWLGVHLNGSSAAPRPSQPTRMAMAAFGLAMVVSYVAAVSRPVESPEVSSADRGMILVASWAGLLLLTTDGLVSRSDLLKLLRFLVGCMGVVGLLGVVQFVTHTSYVDQLQIPGLSLGQAPLTSVYDRNGFARTSGTASHPIEFGVVLAMMLPLALHLATTDLHRSRLSRWAPVVGICSALPLTMSRSAFLGIAVVLVVFCPPGRRRGGRWPSSPLEQDCVPFTCCFRECSAQCSVSSPVSLTIQAPYRALTAIRWHSSSSGSIRCSVGVLQRFYPPTEYWTTSTSVC